MTTATEPEYEKKTFVATTRTAWEMKTAAYSLQLLEQEVKRYTTVQTSRRMFFVAYVADAIACQDFKGKHLHALPPCVCVCVSQCVSVSKGSKLDSLPTSSVRSLHLFTILTFARQAKFTRTTQKFLMFYCFQFFFFFLFFSFLLSFLFFKIFFAFFFVFAVFGFV